MFGTVLKKLRLEKDLTQEDLGLVLNKTKNNISQYETGKRQPDNETLQKIADYFNVSIDYLLGRTDNKELIKKEDNYTSALTAKDERDIEKEIKKLTDDWTNVEGLSLSGDPVSEEAIEAIKESIALAVRQAKLINKKYTPKKFRKDK